MKIQIKLKSRAASFRTTNSAVESKIPTLLLLHPEDNENKDAVEGQYQSVVRIDFILN